MEEVHYGGEGPHWAIELTKKKKKKNKKRSSYLWNVVFNQERPSFSHVARGVSSQLLLSELL